MVQKEAMKQIRLLIPESWIEELDDLAASRFLSRLGVLRFYIRQQMDEDFAQYAEQFREREKLLQTRSKLKTYLNDRD